MPVSDMHMIPAIMNKVAILNPQSIFDIGVGFGKYGALCREILEAVEGRVCPNQWERTIDGLEGFAKYENPLWGVYDCVVKKDYTTFYPNIKGYDLVLFIDSLEHVEKEHGLKILQKIVDSNKHVIVSVPLGEWPQGAVFGNEFERHRSVYKGHEFAFFKPQLLYQGICGAYYIKGNA